MIRTYKAVNGQNIYDVCLMTYGTLDKLPKLLSDNLFPGVGDYPLSGQPFIYDDTLVFNQNVSISNFNNGINYCTAANSTGGQYYNITEGHRSPGGGGTYIPPFIPLPPVGTGDGYFYVLYGNPNIGTDISGNFTYHDPRLVGLSGYSVYANQIPDMFADDYLTYDPPAGKFTINIPGFGLIPASADFPATRLRVFLNLVTL